MLGLINHRRYAATFALLLIAGETAVVTSSYKFWPLALDDYLLCTALLFAAYRVKLARHAPWFMIIWALMIGNLYAMLFTRMDPVGGSGLRLLPLTVLLLLSTSGLFWSLRLWLQSLRR